MKLKKNKIVSAILGLLSVGTVIALFFYKKAQKKKKGLKK